MLWKHSNYQRTSWKWFPISNLPKTKIRNSQHRFTHPPCCTTFCLFKSTESKLVRVRPAATPSGFNLKKPTKKEVKIWWQMRWLEWSLMSLYSLHLPAISWVDPHWNYKPCQLIQASLCLTDCNISTCTLLVAKSIVWKPHVFFRRSPDSWWALQGHSNIAGSIWIYRIDPSIPSIPSI